MGENRIGRIADALDPELHDLSVQATSPMTRIRKIMTIMPHSTKGNAGGSIALDTASTKNSGMSLSPSWVSHAVAAQRDDVNAGEMATAICIICHDMLPIDHALDGEDMMPANGHHAGRGLGVRKPEPVGCEPQ